jgi:hypothetical protein
MLEELGPRALHLVQGRLAMCLAAIADTECGHLDLARATLDRLMPFSAGVLGPSLEFVAIDLGIASGALSGLGQRLEALLASALARRQASHTFAAARLELQLRALRGQPPIDQPGLGELEPPSRAYRDLVALRARALELLSGRTSDALEIESSHTEVRIVTSTVAALAALLGGDAKRALDRARAAQALAKSHAFAVYEAEALELVLAALLLLDRRHELARGADELSALGRRMGSGRFAAEGELWSLAAEPELDRPELVERLAQLDQVAPVAARRARALLGDTAALDSLDQLVIARLHERGFRAPELVTSGAPDAPTWGLDARRRAIWLEDGTRIDLVSRDVPWRLLEVLADAGGAADKETLVARIWAPKEYHPLKHDNRLRLAVRELRRVIEVDVAHPERVLTTDDGYALGGKVRRL